MAFYPEVLKGQEYIVSKQENKLLDSLRATTDFEVIETLTNVKETITEPEKLNSSPTNFHPSLWGMHLYSSALISGLEKINLLPRNLTHD